MNRIIISLEKYYSHLFFSAVFLFYLHTIQNKGGDLLYNLTAHQGNEVRYVLGLLHLNAFIFLIQYPFKKKPLLKYTIGVIFLSFLSYLCLYYIQHKGYLSYSLMYSNRDISVSKGAFLMYKTSLSWQKWTFFHALNITYAFGAFIYFKIIMKKITDR